MDACHGLSQHSTHDAFTLFQGEYDAQDESSLNIESPELDVFDDLSFLSSSQEASSYSVQTNPISGSQNITLRGNARKWFDPQINAIKELFYKYQKNYCTRGGASLNKAGWELVAKDMLEISKDFAFTPSACENYFLVHLHKTILSSGLTQSRWDQEWRNKLYELHDKNYEIYATRRGTLNRDGWKKIAKEMNDYFKSTYFNQSNCKNEFDMRKSLYRQK